jgi:MFS family permease
MTTTAGVEAVAPAKSGVSPVYAWYIVGVLSLCHLVSFIDRTVISLVIQPIKRDLHLSDTAIGLLTGFAFALMFSLFGLPLGRLADMMNRRLIISVGVTVWSAMTALCGFATSVATLFIARLGVGLGEASLAPAAFSILTSYVPANRLGRAASIFTMCGSLGKSVGLLAGGAVLAWLSQPGGVHVAFLSGFKPWQGLFLFAALPGLVVLILMQTVKEPPRKAGPARIGNQYSILDTLRYVMENRAGYIPHLIAAACSITSMQAISIWAPTFLVRKFGLSPADSGYIFGLIVLGPGLVGNLGGGWIADWLRTRGYIDAPGRVMALSLIGAVLPAFIFTMVGNLTLSIIFLALYYMVVTVAQGPSLAGAQILTPPERRGVVTALFLGFVNLTGFGIGPALIGALTDHVYGAESALPYSIATAAALLGGVGSIVAWSGRGGFIATTAKAQS